MNKSDLTEIVASTTGMTKNNTAKAIDGVIEAITEALRSGERVHINGFGNFEVADLPAREGRNPQNGALIKIEASRLPKFRAGRYLRRVLNGA